LTPLRRRAYSLNMFKDSTAGAVPRRADSAETRRHIIDTALALFRERGFEETTIRDVAAAAGLSLGAAYYYFRSKEAIVGAYYDYVQREHQVRARAAFARSRTLRDRLRAAFHSKIDIIQADRRLLAALFRYGGDPGHPLSWFGPATRDQRDVSMAVFAEALAGERLPADVREAAPTLLWTLHMGILLYFLYDTSPEQRRTRTLVDAAIEFVVYARRLATSPFLRPARRRVVSVLREAGLLAAAEGR
jgi:AcrR family transcriptional regulator